MPSKQLVKKDDIEVVVGKKMSTKAMKQFIGELMVALGDESEQRLILQDRIRSLEATVDLYRDQKRSTERELAETKITLEGFRDDVKVLKLCQQDLNRQLDQERQLREALRAMLEVMP